MQKEQIKLEIPQEVKNISRVLSDAGFENFLVGGCVRDLLLNKIPKDWDIATRATPEEVTKLFPKTFYENDYGTVGVVNENIEDGSLKVIEVTPYRTESEYSDKRHPDKVEWATSIQEDLARRDFTINALAYNTETEELIDLFDGKLDLEKKTIRTVGEPGKRFSEDALRIFRALRLSSELGFAIEHETQEAIVKNKELLNNISRERVRDEFVKIIMSENPLSALDMARRLEILKFISPELEKGIGIEQNQAHAYTVWEHLLRSLDHAAKKNFPLHVRLAALLHDIAKPHTRAIGKNNDWTFYGHEVVGAKVAKKILEDLKFPKQIIDQVTKLVRWHMFFSDTEKITLSAVRRLVRNVGTELVWDLMNTRAADRIGTGRPKETPYRLRKYHSMIEEAMRDPVSVKQLKVDGGEIMKITGEKPGPQIGLILEILLSEVLDDPKKNTEEYLNSRVLELHALDQKELTKLGKVAKSKNQSEEEKEINKIREDYHVS